jgi:hypothetical protein
MVSEIIFSDMIKNERISINLAMTRKNKVSELRK